MLKLDPTILLESVGLWMAKYHPTTLLVFRHHIRHAQILYVSVWNFIIRLTQVDKRPTCRQGSEIICPPFLFMAVKSAAVPVVLMFDQTPSMSKFYSDGPSSWWKGFPPGLKMLRCVCLYTHVFLLVVVFYSVSLHSMRCLSRCPECIPLLRLCFFPVHSFLFLLCFSTTVFQNSSSVLEDLSKVPAYTWR